MCVLTELRKEVSTVHSIFKSHGFSPSYNSQQQSLKETHGGELVALDKRWQCEEVPIDDILNNISKLGVLRFACKITIVHDVEIICTTIYLWDSEGFTERNITILQQLYILKRILKLPMFCAGDFSLHHDDFVQSGWANTLHVRVIHPGCNSTLSTTMGRVIDFALVSFEIETMFQIITPVFKVPWGPHIGLLFELNARPEYITALVQLIPKSLPMDQFNEYWKELASYDQHLFWKKSCKRANHILNKHKAKTRVAI